MMFGGMGWGAGMGLGWVFMILFWVFLVAGTVWLILAISGHTGRPAGAERSAALRILEERLARGDVELDEYKARTAAIGGGS